MPGKAVFEEILEIQIAVDKFAGQMDRVVDVYNSKIKNMKPMPGLDGSNNGTTKAVQQLEKTFKDFGNHVVNIMDDVTASLLKMANTTGQTSSQATKSTNGLSAAVTKQEMAERKRFAMIEQAEGEMRKYIATVERAASANDKFSAVKTLGKSGVVGSGVMLGPQTREQAEVDMRRMAALQEQALARNARMSNVSAAQLKAQMSGVERFWTKLTSNFPEFLGQIIKYALGFKLLFMAMEAPFRAISAFAREIKEGFNYLTTLQNRTTDIKEALLESVKYSGDFADNVYKAGKAAQFTTNEIQKVAARFALDPEKVEAGVKAFLQSGGLKELKGDYAQMVDVTGKFLSLLRAGGVNENNQRRFITEVSNMMTGRPEKKSVLLRSLGYTPEEWNATLAEAKKTGDLLNAKIGDLPTLNDRLQAANERLQTADQRWKDLSNSVDLYKRAFFGAMAQPLWEYLLTVLQKVKKFYEEHKEALHLMAGQVGILITDFARLGETIVASFGSFKGVLGMLMSLVARMGSVMTMAAKLGEYTNAYVPEPTDKEAQAIKRNRYGVDSEIAGFGKYTTADDAVVAAYEARKNASIASQNKTKADNKARYDLMLADFDDAIRRSQEMQVKPLGEFIEQLKQEAKDKVVGKLIPLENEQKETQKQINAISGNLANQGKEGLATLVTLKARYSVLTDEIKKLNDDLKNAAPEKPVSYKDVSVTSDSKEAKMMSADRKNMADAVEQNRTVEDALRASTKEAMTDRVMSIEDGTQKIIDSYLREADGVSKAADAILKKFPEYRKKGVDKETLRGLSEDLSKQVWSSSDTAIKGISAAQMQQSKDRLAEERVVSQGIIKQTQDTAQNLIAIEAQRREMDLISESDFIRKKREITANVNAEIEAELQRRIDAHPDVKQEDINALNTAHAKSLMDQLTITNELVKSEQKRLDLIQKQTDLDHQRAIDVAQSTHDAQAQAGVVSTATQYRNSVGDAEAQLAEKQRLNQQAQAQYIGGMQLGATPERLRELADAADQAAQAERMARNQVMIAVAQNPYMRLVQAVRKAAEDFARATSPLKKVEAMLDGLSAISSSVSNIAAQFQQGDVGGGVKGIGDFLSQFKTEDNGGSGVGAKAAGAMQGMGGMIGALGSAIPVVGAVMSFAGPLIGMLGGMFTAAAKKIANEIRKALSDINNAYKAGDATLSQTYDKLQQQRARAISELSGKKGGQDELKKLLPDLDSQLADMKKQIKDTKKQFEEQLDVLRLHTDVLGQWESTWQGINKQVKEYLGAGGSLKNAQEFLSLQLEKQRKQLQTDLSEGEKTAVENAIQLNDLLLQRTQMAKDFAKAEFDTITAGSTERRGANSVRQGQELAQLKAQHDKEIQDIDWQIDSLTKQVDMNKQVFDIATNLNDLHRQDEALTLAALDLELTKYRDMQTLLAQTTSGYTFDPSKWGIDFGGQIPGLTIGAITVNIPASSTPVNGQQIGQDIADELDRRMRSGRTG